MGRTVQGHGHPLARTGRAGGVRCMTITYRDASPPTPRPCRARSTRASPRPSAISIGPRILSAFLSNLSEENWAGELADPAIRGPDRRGGRRAGRLRQARPAEAAGRADGPSDRASPALRAERAWHGAGVAQQLMDWVIDRGPRRGATSIYLSVFIDNHRARRFYERYGFEDGRPLRLHGRQPCRRGHHHAEATVSRVERHPGDQPGRRAARLPRPPRRRFGRRIARASTSATAATTTARRSPRTAAARSRRSLPGAELATRPPGPFGRRRHRRTKPGRTTSGRTPTRWSPTGPACCSAS